MAEKPISALISEKRTVLNKETGNKDPHPYAGVGAEGTYDFGENLGDLVALCSGDKGQEHGEKVVLSNALGNMIVTIQAGIRRNIESGNAAGVPAWLSSYVPGMAAERSRKSTISKLSDNIDNLRSEEEIEDALKFLRAKQKALKNA